MSGKTVLFNQFRHAFSGSFTEREVLLTANTIRVQCIYAAQCLAEGFLRVYLHLYQTQPIPIAVLTQCRDVLSIPPAATTLAPHVINNAILPLWSHHLLSKVLYGLPSYVVTTLRHFTSRLLEVFSPTYVPTVMDMLVAHHKRHHRHAIRHRSEQSTPPYSSILPRIRRHRHRLATLAARRQRGNRRWQH